MTAMTRLENRDPKARASEKPAARRVDAGAKEQEALAHRQAAFAEMQVGFLDDAVASFEKAAALEPDEPRSHANLGVVSKASGRLDEAERHYRDALAVSPDDPDALYNLGNLYWKQGRKAEAAGAYERALRVKPRFAAALNSLGVVRIDAGDLLAAIKLFGQSLEAQPGYLNAARNLAHAYLLDGQPGLALRHYDQAIAQAPGDGRLRLKRVQALLTLDRFDEALAACREAIDAGLRDADLAIVAATILEQKGQGELAEQAYGQAAKIGIQSANGHFQMGLFLLRRGKALQAAADHLHRAIVLEPSHYEAMLALCQAYAGLGRRQQATALIGRILGLSADHGFTARRLEAVQAEARACLARLKQGDAPTP